VIGSKGVDVSTTTYPVTGMTCGHCVRAVSKELVRLPGVAEVLIQLVPGGESSVTVTSAAPLPVDAVTAALDEAGGYRLGSA
jgi:copper chaperone CopZ